VGGVATAVAELKLAAVIVAVEYRIEYCDAVPMLPSPGAVHQATVCSVGPTRVSDGRRTVLDWRWRPRQRWTGTTSSNFVRGHEGEVVGRHVRPPTTNVRRRPPSEPSRR
jgi:hypothetical protein